jgi:hypothetical protein
VDGVPADRRGSAPHRIEQVGQLSRAEVGAVEALALGLVLHVGQRPA